MNQENQSKSKKQKVFVIGLDGATFDIILPLVEKGELPNLAKVMREGAWGELESVIPPSSGPAWTSFQTGKTPSNHGIFDFVTKKANSYDSFYINATNIKGLRLWDILGNSGYKSGIINVMVTYPPRQVNGFLLTGGLTPEGKNFAYPESLAQEIVSRFGAYRMWGVGGISMTDGGEEKFINSYLANEKHRMEIARYLMRNKEWDFFMVMLESTDPLQHELWKYIDKNHPKFKSDAPEYLKNAIPNFYKEADSFLGEMLETLPPDTTICIMSDHGFGPLDRYFLANSFLLEIGMLKLKADILIGIKKIVLKHISLELLYRLARKLGMNRVAKRFRGGKGEVALNFLVPSFADIDWSRTKAFAMGASGHIYLNVKGREPGGIVDPGKEYYEVRDFIMEKLRTLKDSKTGNNAIEKVFTRDELHKGALASQAPDISFLPARGFSTLHRQQFVSPSVFIDSPNCGTHRINGICLFYGPDIEPGKHIDGARIYDLAPTILHLFGLSIPEDMDGKILMNIFREASEPALREAVYSTGAKDAIKGRVKKLRKPKDFNN